MSILEWFADKKAKAIKPKTKKTRYSRKLMGKVCGVLDGSL